MKNLPNYFTLLNLVAGCIAIVLSLQTNNIIIYTGEDGVSTFNIPENLSLAALFLYAAGVIDFLDGFVARFFKMSSEMGKQLDSLADVVSFGVAPAVLLFQLLRMSYLREENGLETPLWLLMPVFIYAVAAAYRLAKFNLDTRQSYCFFGVPTPAAGLLVASFPLILHYGSGLVQVNEWLVNKTFLYSIAAVLAFLMVSNLPIMALKFTDYRLSTNLPKLILLVIGLVSAIFLHWLAVPVLFVAYILISLIVKPSSHALHSTGESNAA